jgi:pimeloyl-ACP methyl ester carboxylesterase
MDVRTVATPLLDISYFEAGAPDGPVAVLMHGFPYDAHACVEAGEQLAHEGWRVVAPWLRGYGPTRFRSAGTMRSGEQAALGSDLLAFLDALDVEQATIAGYDWGGRAACVVAALWPERVAGLITGNGYNIFSTELMLQPEPPNQEWLYWYGFYFHSPRGEAGLAKYTRPFTRLLWEQWSPNWHFDDATFERSAAAFDNPDFVPVVIHSYRHRYGLVPGDPNYAELEERLSTRPALDVPAVVMISESGLRRDFTPDTSRFPRLVAEMRVDGGHNLIQENPAEVVTAFRQLRDLPDASPVSCST